MESKTLWEYRVDKLSMDQTTLYLSSSFCCHFPWALHSFILSLNKHFWAGRRCFHLHHSQSPTVLLLFSWGLPPWTLLGQSCWRELRRNKENSLVIEKQKTRLSARVLKSQQDFKWEEDQRVWGREETGPVQTEALGENKGSQCDGNKGTLVHSVALDTGWVALGLGCCSPGEWKVFMPTIWMEAGAKDSLCPRGDPQTTALEDRGLLKGRVCAFPPICSICQWFPPVFCLWTSLVITVCPSLGHLYQGLVLPRGLEQIWQIGQNTQTN